MAEAQNNGLIVVGFDGSDPSIAALEWAIEDGARRKAKVLAVTVFEIPWTIDFTPMYTESDYGRDAERVQAQALERFHKKHPGVEVETQLIQGKPALVLTDIARQADLLVVGSKGDGALPGMHLGSVASYCVHHSPCPVAVHRTNA